MTAETHMSVVQPSTNTVVQTQNDSAQTGSIHLSKQFM